MDLVPSRAPSEILKKTWLSVLPNTQIVFITSHCIVLFKSVKGWQEYAILEIAKLKNIPLIAFLKPFLDSAEVDSGGVGIDAMEMHPNVYKVGQRIRQSIPNSCIEYLETIHLSFSGRTHIFMA